MPTLDKSKTLLESFKRALSFSRRRTKSDSDAADIAPNAADGAGLQAAVSTPSSPVAMPITQGKTGRGFVSAQVFAENPAAPAAKSDDDADAAPERPRTLVLSDEHLRAFEASTGVLMVSPFLPEDLQDCEWRMATFRVVSTLYSTKTSKVYEVTHPDSGTPLAVKCYSVADLTDLQKIQSMREIWFHSHLTHPNIIALYAAWIEDGRICLAIEYAPIGSAFRKLRRSGHLAEDVAAKHVVFHILCALLFLHELGLIHRDIKPENILLTGGGCKLADMGLVINHWEETANTCLGTFDYMAPELFQLPRKAHPMQFKADAGAQKCDEKVDVWAVGVLVYELVYGKAPFAAKTPVLTCNRIMQGFSGNFPDATAENPGLSEEGKDFVRQATTFDAARRPSVAELLRHGWIATHCRKPAAHATKLRQASFRRMSSHSARLTDTESSWTCMAHQGSGTHELGPVAEDAA